MWDADGMCAGYHGLPDKQCSAQGRAGTVYPIEMDSWRTHPLHVHYVRRCGVLGGLPAAVCEALFELPS